MVVDYLCNAFTPDRRAVWEAAIATSAPNIKIRAGEFCEPEAMVARMDELGIGTMLLPAVELRTGDVPPPTTFEAVASTWAEVEKLVTRWPGRFGALAALDPTGDATEIRAHLRDPWVVGCYIHTHSWNLRFDDPAYSPFYALAAEFEVPVAMQAGMSGDMSTSECGHPSGIDQPASRFPGTRFVLSHTGYPWTEEAIAMASKHANVFLGTASWPPRRWPEIFIDFARTTGAGKVVFGTNFPTVGHAQALEQAWKLDIGDAVLGGTARRVFTRIEDA